MSQTVHSRNYSGNLAAALREKLQLDDDNDQAILGTFTYFNDFIVEQN